MHSWQATREQYAVLCSLDEIDFDLPPKIKIILYFVEAMTIAINYNVKLNGNRIESFYMSVAVAFINDRPKADFTYFL